MLVQCLSKKSSARTVIHQSQNHSFGNKKHFAPCVVVAFTKKEWKKATNEIKNNKPDTKHCPLKKCDTK